MNRNLKYDWLTAALVAIMLAFQVGALLVLTHFNGLEWSSNSQTANINLGLGYVGLIIVESIVLIGAWRLWKRIPERYRKWLKYGIGGTLFASASGLFAYSAWKAGRLDVLAWAIVISAAAGFAVTLISKYDLDWAVHDLMALGIGVGATTLIGTLAAPIVVIPVMVLMMVWDHYAVNLSDLMGDLVEFSTSASLPNYLIIPNRLYVDTDAVEAYVQDMENNEKPEGVTSIIGVGDFAFPALLTTSAWVAGSELAAVFSLVGACVAMVVLRDSMGKTDGGLPALPWLNTGAIGGFAVGTALAVMLAAVGPIW